MIRVGFSSIGLALLFCAGTQLFAQEETKTPSPDFQEVYGLIKAHLVGVSDAELNRAAVDGLLKALGPKVSLVKSDTETSESSPAKALSRYSVLEKNIAYLRIKQVRQGIAKELEQASRNSLHPTN